MRLLEEWNLNNSLDGKVNLVSQILSGDLVRTAATSKQIGRLLSGASPEKMAGITESIESNTLNNDSIARATVE